MLRRETSDLAGSPLAKPNPALEMERVSKSV
jgi:hypothetical protein